VVGCDPRAEGAYEAARVHKDAENPAKAVAHPASRPSASTPWLGARRVTSGTRRIPISRRAGPRITPRAIVRGNGHSFRYVVVRGAAQRSRYRPRSDRARDCRRISDNL